MILQYALSALCVYMFLVLLPTKAQSADLAPDQALKLLEGAIDSIRSFDVEVTATTRLLAVTEFKEGTDKRKKPEMIGKRMLRPGEVPHTSQEWFHQVYQRGKGRVDYLNGLNGKVVRQMVYDPEVEKSWDPKNRSAVIDRPHLTVVMDGMDYRECFRNLVGGASLLDCLRQRKNARISVPTTGSSLLVIESDPVSGRGIDMPQFGFKITVDAAKGFMPTKIEMTMPADGKQVLYTRRTITAWKDLGGGLWVPVKMMSEHFSANPKWKDTFGRVTGETVMVVDVARSSWNQDIPKEAFELPIPAGVEVVDFRRQVKYVTGSADPGKNIESLASDARDMEPITTGFPASGPSLLQKSIIVGTVILGCIAVIVVSFLWLRKRKAEL